MATWRRAIRRGFFARRRRALTVMAAASGSGHHQGARSIAVRFRRSDSLFDLGLQISNIEAGPGLHRRIFDKALNILGNDLARNLEPPHLVFEGIPIAYGSAFKTLFRPAHPFKWVLPQVG